MKILGCDPGLKGAFALLDGGTLDHVRDMPTVKRKVNRHIRPVIDEFGIIEYLRTLDPECCLVIENVHGIQSQSAAGSFNFGYGVGVVTSAALSLGFDLVRVASVTWKQGLKVPRDKQGSRSRATELFGDDVWWPLRGHDGRAEAAMIALYGQSLFERELLS